MAEEHKSSNASNGLPPTGAPQGDNPKIHDQETLEAIAAADKLLVEMSGDFSLEARRQIETIQNAIKAHSATSEDEACERHYQAGAVFEASHELRGQAGTFGYGLLSELCDSLCTLLELEKKLRSKGKGSPSSGGNVWDAIVHHANAVTSIVENDLRGDGGDWGRQLSIEVARLRDVLNHAAA